MKGKLAFIAGAGVGYFLGTRAGREQYERLMSTARSALEHPKVKEHVSKAETAISDAVREQGANVTDKVAEIVKQRLGSGGSTSSSSTGAGDGTANGPAGAWDTPTN